MEASIDDGKVRGQNDSTGDISHQLGSEVRLAISQPLPRDSASLPAFAGRLSLLGEGVASA